MMKLGEIMQEATSNYQMPQLYRVLNFFAKEDEYADFGSICSEMGLAHDHAGVLEVTDKDTSMSQNKKLWCYLRYVCILGARNNVVMLCNTFMSGPFACAYTRSFIESLCKPKHEKAGGIYIATMNQYEKVFPVSDDEINVQRATKILINVPNKENKIYTKFIVLSFIYPGEAKYGSPKGLETMHKIYNKINKKRMGLSKSE